MQRNLMRILVVLAVLAVSGAAQADVIPPQKVDGLITWVYSYAEGQRLAKESGKPLFVVFRCER
jgi:hypothetical protein